MAIAISLGVIRVGSEVANGAALVQAGVFFIRSWLHTGLKVGGGILSQNAMQARALAECHWQVGLQGLVDGG